MFFNATTKYIYSYLDYSDYLIYDKIKFNGNIKFVLNVDDSKSNLDEIASLSFAYVIFACGGKTNKENFDESKTIKLLNYACKHIIVEDSREPYNISLIDWIDKKINRLLIAFVGPKYSGKSTCCKLTKCIFNKDTSLADVLQNTSTTAYSKKVTPKIKYSGDHISVIIDHIVNITFGLDYCEISAIPYSYKEMKEGIKKLFSEQLPIYFPKLFRTKKNVWKWIASHVKSEYLTDYYEYDDSIISTHSFAAPLKIIASVIFGLVPNSIYLYRTKNIIISNRYYSGRQFMQNLGDIYRIELSKIFGKIFKKDHSVWVYLMNKKICETNTSIMIDDVRFPDEIALVNSFRHVIPNVITIKLTTNEKNMDKHASESHFDNMSTDHIIKNNKKNGTTQLYYKLLNIYTQSISFNLVH